MSATNRTGRRFFVYFLSSASGELLYIGRSVDVVARIKAHGVQAGSDTMQSTRKALWLADVTRVDIAGPYFFGEADLRERALIARARPYGNLALNPAARERGWSSKRVAARKQAA